MNKQDVVNMMSQVVEDQGTKKDAERYLEALLKVMEYCVENKDTFKMVGHFSMEVVERAERSGVNPSTKEKIIIPATMAVKFKVGKKLKGLAKQ